MKICIVEGCEKKQHVKLGYCSAHYYKFKAHGDPLGGRRGASPGAPLQWIKDHASYEGDDCIKWPFEISRYGYGSIKYEGKRTTASRVMCIIAHGKPSEPKMDAAHACGNGHIACMNPRHLSWKTRQANVEDMKIHGTKRQGESVHFTEATEEQAREIIRLRDEMKQADIAERVGVTVSTVAHIHCGHTWKHVAEEMGYIPEKRILRGEQSASAKVTEADVREIRRLRGRLLQREIADIFGIDKSQVGKIQRREWWAWVTDE